MLKLPAGIPIVRATAVEAALTEKGRAWLTGADRAPGLHASDMLDIRQGYWRAKDPQPLTRRLVWMFAAGRAMHEILRAFDGSAGSDEGGRYCDELGITYSPDYDDRVTLAEVKTSRSFFDPGPKDLDLYIEQLAIYAVCEFIRTGKLKLRYELRVLYLNLKNEEGQTAPDIRVFLVKFTKKHLQQYRKEILAQKILLAQALEMNDHKGLPLCRAWKCGPDKCEWWNKCQPQGRYDPATGKAIGKRK